MQLIKFERRDKRSQSLWVKRLFYLIPAPAGEIKSYVFDGVPERGAVKEHKEYLDKQQELSGWLQA